ncbi:MAG TPA: helix-turn-helix domain-containing protein [Caulobacteraceae bacterium]|nr:helix-turn-helix domain-containing protein [Caulobacteraceae bacterium]
MAATKRADQKAAAIAKVTAAAKELFTARGYDDVGIRDIATHVGASTGLVFAHFKGKDDLWEAAMHRPAPSRRRLSAFLQQVQATAAGLPLGDEAYCLALDLFGPYKPAAA